MVELPFSNLHESGSSTIKLDEKSKAYVFDTGKGYFHSFEPPTVRTRYRITVESCLLGDQMGQDHRYDRPGCPGNGAMISGLPIPIP
jgi:hypothetical protein